MDVSSGEGAHTCLAPFKKKITADLRRPEVTAPGQGWGVTGLILSKATRLSQDTGLALQPSQAPLGAERLGNWADIGAVHHFKHLLLL